MLDLLSKQQKMRVLVDVGLFISLFLLPWWLVFPAFIFSLFYFAYFFEFVFFVLLFDLMYGTHSFSIFGHMIPVALLALVLFIVVELSKEYLAFNNR
jgi:ABC-type multidrug transport system permease subunit